MGKEKLTKREISWVLYDVGNSAFVMLIATIIPIYFGALAGAGGISEVDYLAYWGYAASLSTLIVAVTGPVLGAAADTEGLKKPMFGVCVCVGALGCAALSVPSTWIGFLVVFVAAKVAYSISLIFYDSMLVDVTAESRLDMVSSHGYAWGYLGSCVPFVISLLLVLGHESLGISQGMAMTGAFLLNAVWWLAMTIPLWEPHWWEWWPRSQERPTREWEPLPFCFSSDSFFLTERRN